MKNLTEYFNIDSTDVDDFIERLIDAKRLTNELSWQDIAYLVKKKYKVAHSRHWYSEKFGEDAYDESLGEEEIEKVSEDMSEDELLKLKKLKVQIQDEKNQNNAYIKKLARDEQVRGIIHDTIKELTSSQILKTPAISKTVNKERENILLISDWHYGLDINNSWNKFNPEICKQRVNKLLKDVIETSLSQKITKLYVLNLSDMIAGRIHLRIRLESRFDVITQIMDISEILAEFLYELSKYFKVEYYSCSDNHSRLEPNKSDAMDEEALYRITDWYLKERLKNDENVTFNENELGEDIITLNVKGHTIAAVHGDKDSPKTAIPNLIQFTGNSYDLVCISHFHHFQSNENGDTILIGNGSLMGVDTYAKDLRLRSKPSQTLITVSEDNVVDFIHKIDLD